MLKRPKNQGPPIEQVVKESIPPADSIVVDAPAHQTAPVSPAVPGSTDTPLEKRPSELQMAVLTLGQLNGRERTIELMRLKTQFGGLKVEDTIVDFIRLGFMDEGQVLTAKGTLMLLKYGGFE